MTDLAGLVIGHVYRIKFVCAEFTVISVQDEGTYVYSGQASEDGKQGFRRPGTAATRYLFPDEVTEVSEDLGTEAAAVEKYASWKPVLDTPEDSGDVDEDIQASRTWSVRFFNDKIPTGVIDVNVYATAQDDDDSGAGNLPDPSESYGVQVLTVYRVCTDRQSLWDSEVWAEEVYEFLPGKPVTLDDAKQLAELIGTWYATGKLRPPRWDGNEWTDHDDRPHR